MHDLMKPRVLVTKHVYPEAIEYLTPHADVDYNDAERGYPPEELIRRLHDKHGVVAQITDKFTAAVMDQLPNLKAISNIAVGYDNIDVPAATARKIAVTNTPDVLTDTTADFAFLLLLAAARRLVEADNYLRAGRWGEWRVDALCGHDVHHRTLGLVGLGRIGQAVARRARGFDMRVLYYDAVRQPDAAEKALSLEFVPFDTLLAEADFISLHVPLLPQTRHLMGAAQFARMKKTAVLVNTSRGPVVDEAALAEALSTGQIAAAGLDVFEREPEVHPGLLKLPNAVLSPHIASASIATRARMCVLAAENVVAAVSGRRPPNLVNRELWEAA